ncbi:hypothetical protein TCDM_03183 [Trypanosoma cruzi Dm28c]|uniref:Uncharacterized protein n=1 Tax=Trypanosoma cruzi Dm28c TaxID=1416333 RepID=V5BJV9_TRYCR|nr:hypothetical protein TCDM_03183 [Trypanosoma cruzi Dm28c]PBJ75662.1 hypothetical protein BCY84_10820 [Trypanosoma cruzi cruzi]
MATHSYYGGYSLIRSSAYTANSNGCGNSCSSKNASSTRDGTRTAGLARMNFASCNSDWMPSLATSSAAEVRSTVMPVDAVGDVVSSASAPTRTPLIQALLAMQNFYRGVPLCVTNTTARNASTTTTVTPPAAPSAKTEKFVASTTTEVSKRAEAKKMLPTIPMPIGGDTWTALSDTVLAAKTGVVASRHALKRPVAPMAVGVTDADLDREMRSTRKGPEPLFRDLLAFSSPSETPTQSAFACNTNNSKRREPVPADELFSFQQHEQEQKQHCPVPPAPISVSPLLSPNRENSLAPEEKLQMFQKQSEAPGGFYDEGHYALRSSPKELQMGLASFSSTPEERQQEKNTIPVLSGGINGATRQGIQRNQLLREGDEDKPLFDEEDEDALEHIRQVINIVLSVNASENASADTDASCKPKKGLEFGMEWLNTRYHQSEQQKSFFQGF